MSFGKHLKRLRESIGLSQRQLALKAGISNTEIWRLEKGERKPSLQTLNKLSLALNVPLHDLLAEAGYILREQPRRYHEQEIDSLLACDSEMYSILKAIKRRSELRSLIKQLYQLPSRDLKLISQYVGKLRKNKKNNRA